MSPGREKALKLYELTRHIWDEALCGMSFVDYIVLVRESLRRGKCQVRIERF